MDLDRIFLIRPLSEEDSEGVIHAKALMDHGLIETVRITKSDDTNSIFLADATKPSEESFLHNISVFLTPSYAGSIEELSEWVNTPMPALEYTTGQLKTMLKPVKELDNSGMIFFQEIDGVRVYFDQRMQWSTDKPEYRFKIFEARRFFKMFKATEIYGFLAKIRVREPFYGNFKSLDDSSPSPFIKFLSNRNTSSVMMVNLTTTDLQKNIVLFYEVLRRGVVSIHNGVIFKQTLPFSSTITFDPKFVGEMSLDSFMAIHDLVDRTDFQHIKMSQTQFLILYSEKVHQMLTRSLRDKKLVDLGIIKITDF